MKLDTLKMQVLAVFAGTDTVITGAEIAALCIATQPNVNVGSLNIADSVASMRQARQYASHILTKVSGGYKVLPRNEWRVLESTGTRGTSKQSLGDAAVSISAKLAAVTHKAESNVPAVTVDAGTSTQDDPTDAELEAMTAPTN